RTDTAPPTDRVKHTRPDRVLALAATPRAGPQHAESVEARGVTGQLAVDVTNVVVRVVARGQHLAKRRARGMAPCHRGRPAERGKDSARGHPLAGRRVGQGRVVQPPGDRIVPVVLARAAVSSLPFGPVVPGPGATGIHAGGLLGDGLLLLARLV